MLISRFKFLHSYTLIHSDIHSDTMPKPYLLKFIKLNNTLREISAFFSKPADNAIVSANNTSCFKSGSMPVAHGEKPQGRTGK